MHDISQIANPDFRMWWTTNQPWIESYCSLAAERLVSLLPIAVSWQNAESPTIEYNLNVEVTCVYDGLHGIAFDLTKVGSLFSGVEWSTNDRSLLLSGDDGFLKLKDEYKKHAKQKDELSIPLPMMRPVKSYEEMTIEAWWGWWRGWTWQKMSRVNYLSS